VCGQRERKNGIWDDREARFPPEMNLRRESREKWRGCRKGEVRWESLY
jgi:hypothetical protein